MPTGVEVKKVDYDDQASLVEALQGQDALIITMGIRAPPDQQTKLIEAAAEANVSWVLPNEYGYYSADPGLRKDIPLGEHHAKYREQIEKLGKSSWIAVTCRYLTIPIFFLSSFLFLIFEQFLVRIQLGCRAPYLRLRLGQPRRDIL